MIICEGPDGGGKTTLARAIAKQCGMEYRRPPAEALTSSGGPTGVALYDWWSRELIRPTEERVGGVYDRCFFISEPIYQLAQVERDLIVPGSVIQRGILDLWAEGPMIVFCLPPFDQSLSNVIQDGRASLKGLENKHLEKVDFLYWATLALWQNGLFETISYDYTNDTPDFVYERVTAWVEANKTNA
jgi:hypothetical protein